MGKLQGFMVAGASVVTDSEWAVDWAARNLASGRWNVVHTKPWYYTYPDAFNYIKLSYHEAVGLLSAREYPAKLAGMGALVFVDADRYPPLALNRLQELVDARRVTMLGLEARDYSVVVCARQPWRLPPTLVAKCAVVLVPRRAPSYLR